MGIRKKLMTVVLAAALTLSLAVPALAVTGSPTNPGFDPETGLDVNYQDHDDKTTENGTCVTTKVSTSTAVTKTVTAGTGKTSVDINVARDRNNKKKPITRLGDAKNGTGVFNSTAGKMITTVRINSPAAQVNVSAYAFKGSNAKNLYLKSKKVVFAKNSFNGTKAKDINITIFPNADGSMRTSSSIGIAQQDAFKGLSSSATITVKKGSMTVNQFRKLRARLIAAGFPGKIVRK